ncbi:MAG: hypothetical protein AAGJ40_15155 [Planctomycetota bacterium]
MHARIITANLLLLVAFGTGTTLKAEIILTVTGDGNSGSTWTLSGSGTSTAPGDFLIWAFAGDPFFGFSGGAPGSMTIGGVALNQISPGDVNQFDIGMISPLATGVDLSTASGSFVNTDASTFDGGLSPNTTLVSVNSTPWGTLTITNATAVPEPRSFLPMVMMGLAWMGSRRHRRTR